MNINKLIFSICMVALFFGLAVTTNAQNGSAAPPPQSAMTGPSGHHGGMDADAPELDPALNLTDDQKTKIKSIRDDAKDQMTAMKKDTALTDDQRQQKVKQLRMDTRKQIWAVMTPEQQKTWAQEQRERRQAKHEGDAPASTPPQ